MHVQNCVKQPLSTCDSAAVLVGPGGAHQANRTASVLVQQTQALPGMMGGNFGGTFGPNGAPLAAPQGQRRHEEGETAVRKVFVGGLPGSCTQEVLQEYFSQYGMLVRRHMQRFLGTAISPPPCWPQCLC